MKFTHISLAAIALLTSVTSYANISIRFIEGAPKDTFIINNTSACTITELTVDIDLAPSAGKLIFDTTNKGAGVEVYQPFEARSGQIMLTSEQHVSDGNDKLSIQIENLGSKQSASFTIDVDDRLTDSELGQIRVSNAEIEGAIVRVQLNNTLPIEGSFNNRSNSTISLPSCV